MKDNTILTAVIELLKEKQARLEEQFQEQLKEAEKKPVEFWGLRPRFLNEFDPYTANILKEK